MRRMEAYTAEERKDSEVKKDEQLQTWEIRWQEHYICVQHRLEIWKI